MSEASLTQQLAMELLKAQQGTEGLDVQTASPPKPNFTEMAQLIKKLGGQNPTNTIAIIPTADVQAAFKAADYQPSGLVSEIRISQNQAGGCRIAFNTGVFKQNQAALDALQAAGIPLERDGNNPMFGSVMAGNSIEEVSTVMVKAIGVLHTKGFMTDKSAAAAIDEAVDIKNPDKLQAFAPLIPQFPAAPLPTANLNKVDGINAPDIQR